MSQLRSLQQWEAQPLPETAHSRASDRCRGRLRSAPSRCYEMLGPAGQAVGGRGCLSPLAWFPGCESSLLVSPGEWGWCRGPEGLLAAL